MSARQKQCGEIVIGTRDGDAGAITTSPQWKMGAQELRTWSALFSKNTPGQESCGYSGFVTAIGHPIPCVSRDDPSKASFGRKVGGQLRPACNFQVVALTFPISSRLRCTKRENLILGQQPGCAIVDVQAQLAGVFDARWRFLSYHFHVPH